MKLFLVHSRARRIVAPLLVVFGLSLLALSLFTPGKPARAKGFVFALPPNLVTPNSGRRNNIFYVGDQVAFTLNNTSAVRYEVRDYWGNIVDQGPAATSLAVNVHQPGWYKLNLYGAVSQAPWGYTVGGATFVIFRSNPHFPTISDPKAPGTTDPIGAEDEAMRSIMALGPQRHYVQDANNPSAAITTLTGDIALDKQYTLGFNDPIRPSPLMIAFPNGTSNLAGVSQVVSQFQNQVQYYEPRNEPNGGASGANFAINEMKPFYQTIKSINPNLKVMGPGTVSVGPAMLPWLTDFFNAGGGNYIDAFSFHAYNNVLGDLWLARTSLDSLTALLNKYGQNNKEIWQTEQGYMAAVYGAYEPRHQGRWTMLQMMVFEQYGIPKEHNHLWYDLSHGYWANPMFTENGDGTLNPAAALMRVWSEELYGTRFTQAYNLGATGNKLYVGSLFQGPNKSVAAFMSAGSTDGQITLQVQGGDHLHLVSAQGVERDLPVTGGQAVLPIPEIPVYVELAPGQTITPTPIDWGTNLALQPGVTAKSSGLSTHPLDPNDTNAITKVFNGTMENVYWGGQDNDHPWMSNVSSLPGWFEMDLPTPQIISKVVIYCPVPWQWEGSLLDYQLQYDNNGQWVTIDHVTEDPKTYSVFSPSVSCTVDSYYSDRNIFTEQFAPVLTGKIRIVVNNCTWGGGATQAVDAAGGQTGPQQFSFREIEVYGPSGTTPPVTVPPANVPPTVSMTAPTPGASVTTGTSVSLAAAAADSDGTVANVAFYANGALINTATTSPYTANWTPGSSGTYSLTAVATDNQGATTTSTSVSVTVAPVPVTPPVNAPPAVSMTAPTGGASVTTGTSVSLTATAGDTDGTVAQVAFYANSTLIGTAGASPYTINWTPTVTGIVSLTAVATDNQGATTTSTPVSITVTAPNVPPSVSLTAPMTGRPVMTSPPGIIAAAASDTDGTIAQVAFYANGSLVATSATSPYTVSWQPNTPGIVLLTAVATDNQGASAISTPIIVLVMKPNVPPSVSITSPVGGKTLTPGVSTAITAAASDSDGTVSSVSFYAGTTLIGTSTASPYTINWTPTVAGSYSLTAIATDNKGATTTSTPTNVSVTTPITNPGGNSPPSVSLSVVSGGTTVTLGSTVPIFATAADSDGTIAKVAFYINGNLFATGTAYPYTVNVRPGAVGTYTFTAIATDNQGATTTSNPLAITIK